LFGFRRQGYAVRGFFNPSSKHAPAAWGGRQNAPHPAGIQRNQVQLGAIYRNSLMEIGLGKMMPCRLAVGDTAGWQPALQGRRKRLDNSRPRSQSASSFSS